MQKESTDLFNGYAKTRGYLFFCFVVFLFCCLHKKIDIYSKICHYRLNLYIQILVTLQYQKSHDAICQVRKSQPDPHFKSWKKITRECI